MSEKRFKLAYCDYDWWAICDNENKNELGVSGQEVVDVLNELNDENQRLKKALLFFVDVATSECSSNWKWDMENACQRLFNCSYEEAKEKYDDYDGIWWELGL